MRPGPAIFAAEAAVRCVFAVVSDFFVEFVSVDESAVVGNCVCNLGQFHHASVAAVVCLVEHSLGSDSLGRDVLVRALT